MDARALELLPSGSRPPGGAMEAMSSAYAASATAAAACSASFWVRWCDREEKVGVDEEPSASAIQWRDTVEVQ